jgi:4-hydroxybenzoate polyprenyltransferase
VILDCYISLLQRFFILSSLLIPFEIMDTKTDPKSLNTLPQLFGIRKAKQLGYGFIVVFLFLEFINFRIYNFLIDAVIAIVTVIFIRFISLENDEYYTSFWVESVPIFWLGLLILFQ